MFISTRTTSQDNHNDYDEDESSTYAFEVDPQHLLAFPFEAMSSSSDVLAIGGKRNFQMALPRLHQNSHTIKQLNKAINQQLYITEMY